MSAVERFEVLMSLTDAKANKAECVLASDYDQLLANYSASCSLYRKAEAESNNLRTANQRLEGEVKALREALELWLADYDEVAANPDFEPFPHIAERVAKTRAALRGNGGE